MIELMKGYLEEWHKRKELLSHIRSQGLKIDERTLRQYIRKYRNEYSNGEHDSYIVDDPSKGYKLTSDRDEIRKALERNLKRGLTIAKESYAGLKRLRDTDQISLLEQDVLDAFEVLLKVGDEHES